MSAEENPLSSNENKPSTRVEDILLERLKNEPEIAPQVGKPILMGILLLVLVLGTVIYFLTRKPEQFAEDPHSPQNRETASDSAKVNSKRMKLAPLLDSLEHVLVINPNDPSAHLGLADLYYEAEYWEKAEEEYQFVLKADPENVDARVDYAFVLTQTTGDYHEAVLEIKKALKYDPEHVNALFNAGILTIRANLDNKKKAVSEAIPFFNRAMEAAKKQHNDKMAEQIAKVMAELEKMQTEEEK